MRNSDVCWVTARVGWIVLHEHLHRRVYMGTTVLLGPLGSLSSKHRRTPEIVPRPEENALPLMTPI